MPIYDYKCNLCKREVEEYRGLSERLQIRRCAKCGGELFFILAAKPKGRDIYPYLDEMIDHKPILIESRGHYLKELKSRGLSERPRGRGNKGQWV